MRSRLSRIRAMNNEMKINCQR
eukprot:SAG31_NODE_36968_length_308_cov_1.478469_1_plen_21_part_10